MSKQEKHPPNPGEERVETSKVKGGGRRKGMFLEDRPLLEPNTGGIDIGAREIFVAVPPERDEHSVRVFAQQSGHTTRRPSQQPEGKSKQESA